jgi:hypothetical protein
MMTTLSSILPFLPPEAQHWIDNLPPHYRRTMQDIVDLVGEDNFLQHWQTHREDQQNIEHDFG